VEALLGEQNGWERFYLSRRDFIRYSLATGVAEWAGSTIPAGLGISRAEAQELFEVDATRSPEKVFPQSVASGDPQPRGIVLWTRVNSKIARRGANLARVAYEISESEDFSNPILQGVAETNPSRDYTVKVQLDSRSELEPFTTYYYRFIFQRTENRPGRFKTLPAASAELSSLRLGYTSCQDYTNGYYHALRNDLDPPPDSDDGPNHLQNFPEITSAKPITKRIKGKRRRFTVIRGILGSTPGETFTIQFFSSPAAEESGYGEGKTFAGQLTKVTTDTTNGDASFAIRVARRKAPVGSFIAATATNNSTGDTSEFSKACTVPAEPCPPDES
jgi:PhoD-like phosphatase, N-terminal domain